MTFSKFYSSIQLQLRFTTILIRPYHKKPYFRPPIMPKDNKYLLELQKQRRRMKAIATKFSPSHIYLQVIGNGSKAEPRALLLVTDHTNYLFNCGEGTQRLASEHHAKLTKIEHIFVTKPTWRNMGGIPGVQLTIQDTGVPKVVLHGPDGTIDLVEATKNFITLNQLEVLPADLSTQFNDHTMTVDYVPLENCVKSEIDEPVLANFQIENINFYDYHRNANNKRPRSPNSSNKEKLSSKSQKRIMSMMAYICKIHPRSGTLDITKCVDLGVPAGPLLGKLKSGEDITLPNGKLIRSQDVTAPPEPGPIFIVLECPHEDWIDIIVENPVFAKHQKTAVDSEKIASYVVHFAPENVINNQKYKDWMSRFGTDTKHLILNEKNNGYSSEAIHKMQYQLNLMHPTIFPLLSGEKLNEDGYKVFPFLKERRPIYDENSKNELENNKTENDKNIEVLQTPDNLHYCETLNEVHLRPHNGLDTTDVKLNVDQYYDEVYKVPDFTETLEDLRKAINGHTKTLDSFEEYPKLLMLGTGSSIPNKIRNTSGMLLQIDEERSIILDCGEGTLGQLYRFFGNSQIDKILKSIKAIYVSHLHADHHLGLIGLLKERERVTDEPVFLLAPQLIVTYLFFYHNRFESIAKLFRLVNNRELLMNQVLLSNNVSRAMHESLNVSNIVTCYVRHCPYAFGVAITLKDGKKICYSGDTVPCDSFLKLAKDSYLLIHEATMEDSLEAEAIMKFHSTISQAINVGVKADAKFTLLTHFSQRYSKIPMLPFRKEGGPDFTQVGIAYDFMMISLSQLPLLHLFYSTLNLMFSEFRSLLDERSSKRELRKELNANSVKN